MKQSDLLLKQIFSIPIEKYILYAPLNKIAFLCNSTMVNLIFERYYNEDNDQNTNPVENGNFLNYLEKLNFFSPEDIYAKNLAPLSMKTKP